MQTYRKAIQTSTYIYVQTFCLMDRIRWIMSLHGDIWNLKVKDTSNSHIICVYDISIWLVGNKLVMSLEGLWSTMDLKNQIFSFLHGQSISQPIELAAFVITLFVCFYSLVQWTSKLYACPTCLCYYIFRLFSILKKIEIFLI